MTDKPIDTALHKLAKMVIATCSSSTDINLELLNDKSGAIIFLLSYAKYYNIDKYKSYAMGLLEYIQDSSIISNDNKVIIHNLIDIGMVMNYIGSQELATGNLDDLLEEADSFLLSCFDNKYSLYLTYRELTTIGKYFLLRIAAAPLSLNHQIHIKALNKAVELLKFHIANVPICNPVIVKFLYLSSLVLPNKSIESLLIQQLNNYPNHTTWYRYVIPNWFNTFFIPEDHELLRKIIIKEVEEYCCKYSDNDGLGIISGGTSGLIVWMNLLSDNFPKEKYNGIKNTAVEKITSNIDRYKISTDVSINRGCSGIGLALLSCIDSKCNQWIKLL